MNLTKTRLLNQQLLTPQFTSPQELVSWMGMMQAQDYNMAKWAVGLRLETGNLSAVENALRKGDVIRIHVARPTWHIVSKEDVRWMVALSSQRIKQVVNSYDRTLCFSEEELSRFYRVLEKTLAGTDGLTRPEIKVRLAELGFEITDNRVLTHLMVCAETDAVVCSGIYKKHLSTYMLMDERVPLTQVLTKDESLEKLARKYFQSHSPATLQDFCWWSGLTMADTKRAINIIDNELLIEKCDEQIFYIHSSCRIREGIIERMHLLPAFDEYLIAYKGRTMALPTELYKHAFTNNGIFYQVVLKQGNVVGNWKKQIKKDTVQVEYSWLDIAGNINQRQLSSAENRLVEFLKP